MRWSAPNTSSSSESDCRSLIPNTTACSPPPALLPNAVLRCAECTAACSCPPPTRTAPAAAAPAAAAVALLLPLLLLPSACDDSDSRAGAWSPTGDATELGGLWKSSVHEQPMRTHEKERRKTVSSGAERKGEVCVCVTHPHTHAHTHTNRQGQQQRGPTRAARLSPGLARRAALSSAAYWRCCDHPLPAMQRQGGWRLRCCGCCAPAARSACVCAHSARPLELLPQPGSALQAPQQPALQEPTAKPQPAENNTHTDNKAKQKNER